MVGALLNPAGFHPMPGQVWGLSTWPTLWGGWPARKNMPKCCKSSDGTVWCLWPLPQRLALAVASAARMVLRMQQFEAFTRHMGVDGGSGNVCMPQQQLHHAQIGTVVQQVRGKGMAQRVR